MVVALRTGREVADDLGHRLAVGGIADEILARLDQRPGDRVGEDALGQHGLEGRAEALLSDGVDGFEADDHRQSGPAVGGEVHPGAV